MTRHPPFASSPAAAFAARTANTRVKSAADLFRTFLHKQTCAQPPLALVAVARPISSNPARRQHLSWRTLDQALNLSHSSAVA